MSLAFKSVESHDHSYEVSTGQQKLGRVSYTKDKDSILITELVIEPYLQNFGIEAQIIDALLADDSVKAIKLISDLSDASMLFASGFVCDPKQVLLTKNKA